MSSEHHVRVATDARLLKRSCESLLGIAAGLVADGQLNDLEIQFLSTWLSENPSVVESWPGEVLALRVRTVLADGVISEAERAHLVDTLEQLVGGSFSQDGAIATGVIALPFDNSATVQFVDKSFCFTGKFVFGTRAACESEVLARGASLASIQRRLSYLVGPAKCPEPA